MPNRSPSDVASMAAAVVVSCFAVVAAADEATSAPPPAPEPAPAPKAAPYSLPWQLRPVGVSNGVRLDTVYAVFKPDTTPAPDKGGHTLVTMLSGSYKVIPELAIGLRVGYLSATPPTPAGGAAPDGASAFTNPVLSGAYSVKTTPDTRLGLFLGLVLPFGSGGGNDPATDLDAGRKKVAQGYGLFARSAMDNSMFAPNFFTVVPGVGFAWMKSGVTVQAEATLFFLQRVKGDQVDKDLADGTSTATRINSTVGLHLGYFVVPELSLGLDLRHQQWLKNATIATDLAARNNTTLAFGPRVHLDLGGGRWLRPGIAYARALDKPMSGEGGQGYHVVQVDVPFVF